MKHKLLLFNLIIFACLVRVNAQAPQQVVASAPDTVRKYQTITGILGAFPAEVSLIHDVIQNKQELIIQHIHFTRGLLNGRQVVLAQTGIGKVNAAITTTLLIEHFEPAEILFTGIAGGVDPQLSPGDLVIGTTVAYHDYGTITPDSMMLRRTRNPITMTENPIYFPCDQRLFGLAQLAAKEIVLDKIDGGKPPKIVTGTIVTGDVFVSSTAATVRLHTNMHAEATEMEGASVGQTCWQQKVPFLVIRSLSDGAGNNAHADVAAFYKTAAHNSATMVMAVVAKLK